MRTTSHQRVLSAINHRQPDRVPIDLGGTPSSGVSAIAYHHLVRCLGLDVGPAKVYDVVQQLAQLTITAFAYAKVEGWDQLVHALQNTNEAFRLSVLRSSPCLRSFP